MENIFLSERTSQEIDTFAQKILQDLDWPEPPLDLDHVREVLELDRAYYSSTDQGVLSETIHKMKMAGKQVLRNPSRLLDVVKKRSLKALWLPERKRILLDSELPTSKQRWAEAHEVGHSVIPWHESMTHGDQKQTLSYTCHEALEAEANFAAGRLLFLGDRFRDELGTADLTLKRIQSVGKGKFGNTITSSLWRAIESSDIPCVGMISKHPLKHAANAAAVRYFIRSPEFNERFSRVRGLDVYSQLPEICKAYRGPLGEGTIAISDDNGLRHEFFFESFFNSYDVLTLGVHCRVMNSTTSVGVS